VPAPLKTKGKPAGAVQQQQQQQQQQHHVSLLTTRLTALLPPTQPAPACRTCPCPH
jgi:uncharacterized coiled-coil protein SlyX